jgi:ABC-type nitrate/sulfonate/bicarbonate transport system substrate-binding protein
MRRIFCAVLAAASVAVLGACGSDDPSSKASAGSSGSGSTSGIRVAYASDLDPNDVADQFGLQAAGAKVQTLNDDSAVIAGLQRGSIDVGNVDFNQAVSARSKGLPIKIIYVGQTTPEYVLVGRPEVASLNDLADKKVGFQEPGSQTELFAKNIVKEKAPDIYDKVQFLALAESSRRAQALVAKRLDASPVESINLAQLEKQGAYHQLATWADLSGDASKAIGTAWITTDKVLVNDKARITAFVKDLQKGYNTTYNDKDAWVALAKKTLPDVDASLLPTVYDIYTRRNMYPKSGQPALTPETWSANEKFYRSIGEWDKEQSSEVVDFDTINAGAQESGATTG